MLRSRICSASRQVGVRRTADTGPRSGPRSAGPGSRGLRCPRCRTGLHLGLESEVDYQSKAWRHQGRKLTTSQVKQFIRDRLKTVKPATVNRELSLLHRAFQLGYQHDPPLVARVPHFQKLPEGEPRRGFLKPELYRILLRELPDELRLLFVIAYHVGLRRGALLRIKWSQVDLDASCIWMDGKRANRKPEPVAVPIYGDMGKFLAVQPKDSDFLFARGSRPIQNFRDSWIQACERAGVPNLLFHDLRRTAVRNLRRAGVAETVIMKITGHRTRSVFERYNITDQSDTQQAGRLAEDFLAKEHQGLAQTLTHEPKRLN